MNLSPSLNRSTDDLSSGSGSTPPRRRHDRRPTPSSAASARSNRSGSSVAAALNSGRRALGDPVAGQACQTDAGAGLHRVARGSCGPRRAATPLCPTASASSRVSTPTTDGRPPRRDWAGRHGASGVAVTGPGPSPATTSIAEPSASALGRVDVGRRPAPASISRASARVSSTHVGRAAAGQHLDRLRDLDRVAGACSPSGVDMSVSRATVCTPCVGAEVDHRAGQLARVRLDVLHERAGADLDVEHQRAGALGDLLAHDRADAISGIASTVPVTSRSA